jgi:hypothetical protein
MSAEAASACSHRTPDCWEWSDYEHPITGERIDEQVNTGGKSTQEDVDVGRFRCSQCGEVGYYTGQWKRFYEEGVPCLGSDRVSRTTGSAT